MALQEMLLHLIPNMYSDIVILKLLPYLLRVNELFYHDMQISWPDSDSPPIRLSDS